MSLSADDGRERVWVCVGRADTAEGTTPARRNKSRVSSLGRTVTKCGVPPPLEGRPLVVATIANSAHALPAEAERIGQKPSHAGYAVSLQSLAGTTEILQVQQCEQVPIAGQDDEDAASVSSNETLSLIHI